MNKKKNVIFNLNNHKQYFGEFHENSKIKLIKAYFRDISNIIDYNIVYNNEYLCDDEISLKDVVHSNTKSSIIFYIEELNLIDHEEEKQTANNKILNAEKTNEELSTKLNSSKKEIEKLRDIIEELNINTSVLQKKIDNLQKENSQLQTDKINLIKEAEEYQKEIKELKSSKINQQEITNKNIIYQQQPHNTSFKSRTSVLGNNLVETTNKNASNNNVLNNNVTPLSLNKKASVFKSTDSPGKSPFANRKSISPLNIINKIDPNDLKTSEKNELNSINLRKSIINPPNKLTEINSLSNKMMSLYSEKKLRLDEIRLNIYKQSLKKIIDLNQQNVWNEMIFPFLGKESLISFSMTSKKNMKLSIKFFFDGLNEKKKSVDELVKVSNDFYKSILFEKRFELSLSTTSAIKILNKPLSLEVYNKDITYFSNPLILMCYQLLFQISKVIENAISLDINEVLEMIRNLVLNKLNPGYGLGDYIKTLSLKACFDEENVDKIKSILKKYDMKKIDLALMGKLCKTTGMIAFYIKDALNYCGLELEKDKNLVKRRTRSGSMINLLADVDSYSNESEKLKKNLDYLEYLLNKI